RMVASPTAGNGSWRAPSTVASRPALPCPVPLDALQDRGYAQASVALLPESGSGLPRYLHGRLATRSGGQETGMRLRVLTAALAVCVLSGCANNQDAGTAIGAITGGVLGHQCDKGSGKVPATLPAPVRGALC